MLESSGLFGPVETAVFAFEQVVDRATLLDLVLSRSYCAKLPPADREPVLDAVGALYDEHGRDGRRPPAYVTECFRATKKRSEPDELEAPASTAAAVEGLAVLTGAIVLYFDASYGWLLLLVVPRARLSMLGYLGGPRSAAHVRRRHTKAMCRSPSASRAS